MGKSKSFWPLNMAKFFWPAMRFELCTPAYVNEEIDLFIVLNCYSKMPCDTVKTFDNSQIRPSLLFRI